MGQHYDVVIVGGGPVGTALAIDLTLRGVSCALVERRTEVSRIPKGQNLTHRTMEHLRRWGIADELRTARVMPPGYPIGMLVVYGSLLGEHWQAPRPMEQWGPYFTERNERLPQYLTEAVLRRRLERLGGVHVYRGWRAASVRQDEHGVTVEIERDEVREVLTGGYLVGCDGGRSTVAEQVGITKRGTDFGQSIALAVFKSTELHQLLERLPSRSTYRVMAPYLNGYWAFFGRIDVGEGFFFHAPVPRGQSTEDADIAGMLHRAAGKPFAYTLEHLGFWDARVQIAQRYRAGRVFVAGDAAHTHPPYGGFGLNNGLEDAVNLGWKLAAVLQGWGGPGLLDSYDPERRGVFHDVGEHIIAGAIRREREWLNEHSVEVDPVGFAEQFGPMAEAGAALEREYVPHYAGSSIVVGPPGAVTGARERHSLLARPGHHLAPARLSDGREVFDALGDRFTLLAFDSAASLPGVRVVRDTLTDGRERYGSRLILVRPDQHVAWAGDVLPADPDALLRQVTGAPFARTGIGGPRP